MKHGMRAMLLLALAGAPAVMAGAAAPGAPFSPALRAFLQAEMREIAGSVQAITVALATADWDEVVARATRIRDSAVAHQDLTAAQRRELEALPAGFHDLDAAFHERAGRLAAAAAARDAELAAYQLHRLTEGCVACHARFVGYRFDGFGAPAPQEHRH